MIRTQLFRFGVVGALVSVMHLLLVFFLTDIVGVWYLYSTVISYVVATISNFFFQKFYVMRHTETSETHIQFVKYILLALLCLLINTVGMYALVELLHIPYVYAQILVLGFLAAFTFIVSRTYVFR